eukprot:2210767-Pyramimonas_sp.AAC.1
MNAAIVRLKYPTKMNDVRVGPGRWIWLFAAAVHSRSEYAWGRAMMTPAALEMSDYFEGRPCPGDGAALAECAWGRA